MGDWAYLNSEPEKLEIVEKDLRRAVFNLMWPYKDSRVNLHFEITSRTSEKDKVHVWMWYLMKRKEEVDLGYDRIRRIKNLLSDIGNQTPYRPPRKCNMHVWIAGEKDGSEVCQECGLSRTFIE